MQGHQKLKESLFIYNINLDNYVPQSHILRKINKIVDLSFIRELTKNKYCTDNGRPSIDPELFFRLMIVKYLYGIESERRLCEDIQLHMGYRWFCQLSLEDSVPHHSSLTKIRTRLGDSLIEEFFDQIVSQCRDHGLVKGTRIITDGTIIEANASLNSLEANDPLVRLIEENNENEHRSNPDGKIINRKLSNKTHTSRTDPDSSLAYKTGTPRVLKYKGHYSIDSEYSIILDPFISTGADHETTHYIDRLDYIQKKFHLNYTEAVADRGYGTGNVLTALHKRNISALIPLFHRETGASLPDGFSYDSTTNSMKCPNGEDLIPSGKKDSSRRQRYKVKGDVCVQCKLSHLCTARYIHSKKTPRFVQRSDFQTYYDLIRRKMNTPYFKAASRERFYKIEGLFSQAKRIHKLKRAQFRGRSNMQIQSYFTAAVLNIKKLVEIVGKTTFSFRFKSVIRPLMRVASLFMYPFRSFSLI
jgi:transposase